MASELRVDTLKDSSGNNSVGMSYVSNGSAKVWFHYNGSGTAAFRDSFNCASLTDNGTGDHTANFTNSMNNAEYSLGTSAGNGNDGDTANSQIRRGTSATGSQRCTAQYPSAVFDYKFCSGNIFGDLA